MSSAVKVWLGGIEESGHNADPQEITSVNFTFAGTNARMIANFCGTSIGVPANLLPCFALYYVSPAGWTHHFADDQVPPPELVGDYVYRRITLRGAEEAGLMKCEKTVDLLFADAAANVDIDELGGSAAELQQLDDFADPAFLVKRQYVELAQTLPRYPVILLKNCVLAPNTDTVELTPYESLGLGKGEASWSLSFDGFKMQMAAAGSKEVNFELNRIKCWSFTTEAARLDRMLKTAESGDFAFEYFSRAKMFIWIRVLTPEANSIGQELQRIVPHLYSDQQGAQWPEMTKAEVAANKTAGKTTTSQNHLFGF